MHGYLIHTKPCTINGWFVHKRLPCPYSALISRPSNPRPQHRQYVLRLSNGHIKASTLNPQQPQRRRYVLRRSNGYFVDSSYGFDRFDTFDYKAGSGEVVAGFDQAIKGMYPGGRRRWVWVTGWRVLVISLI